MKDSRLLLQTVGSLLVCAGLVIVCYYCVDWPVARWCNERADQFPYVLYHPPDAIAVLAWASPFLLLWTLIQRARRPWRRWEALLMATMLNVVVVTALKYLLKWVFGRPTPLAWFGPERYLTDPNDYVFNWFHGQHSDGFPSGHTAIVCAVASIVWIIWPKWRWLAVAAVMAIVVLLVIGNYHFVGDTVGGGFLGWLGGVWTVKLLFPQLGLAQSDSPASA